MKPSTIVGLVSVPIAIAGLYWLMIHGYLELSAYLLAGAVLALLVGTLWEWRHGHPKWAALLFAGAVLTAGTVGWYGWHLNQKFENIQRVDDGVLDEGDRPAAKPTKALNILLMGSDDPQRSVEKPTVAELLASGEWDVGAYRSDSMMVVHIPADRSGAYVVSIPRDSYVEIYDDKGEPHGKNKVNSAFSLYGPFGTWRTVENLSGLRLNHMAIIDFEGFRDLTTAIGGVDVYVPETVTDTQTDTTWEQGMVHLEDELALKYVRMRYGLTEGDFDRVDRQQNFLRAVMAKVLADETIGNPLRFSNTLESITSSLTIDQSWSNGQLRSLAFSLRGINQEKVRFMTLPFARYDSVPDAGSVIIVDEARAKELWAAMSNDRVGAYLEKYPDDELPDPRDVS